MKECKFSIVLLLLLSGYYVASPILAQDVERFALEFEGGALWQTRNDVRIPNDTGTEFSFVDEIGKGPNGVFRVEAAFDLNEKHGFRIVFAPLEIKDTALLDKSVFLRARALIPAFPRMQPTNLVPTGLPTATVSMMALHGAGRSDLPALSGTRESPSGREIRMLRTQT